MDFIDIPAFYLAAIPAILLTGISKGGFAGAFSGLSVPLLALAISLAILFGATPLQRQVGLVALVVGAALYLVARWRSR